MEEQASPAVFGVFDGMVSVIGVILGLLATADTHTILAGAIGLAAASAASMGAGEYLGDVKHSWRNAGIMGFATLVGTLVPIIPFLFLPKVHAVIGASIFTIVAACWIAEKRSKYEPRSKSYLETFVILAIALCVTIVVALLTGLSG